MATGHILENTVSTTAITSVIYYKTILIPLVSDAELNIFNWVVLAVLLQVIDLFGITTNAINIICFARQGFDDPINISLIGKTFVV